jgi:2-amino-4-hydroxy-6-hydroxymethyldihydropteridine diphosphokinase
MALNPESRKSVAAYVGLGSNQEDPVAQIIRALDELSGLPDTELITHSHLYQSTPMGPITQPDFINAVAKLRTDLEPLSLLDALLEIERAHGRMRHERWGPRTLDLDLLLYAKLRYEDKRLELPHPGITRRAFVLLPLLEIAPQLAIPGHGMVADLIDHLNQQDVYRVN